MKERHSDIDAMIAFMKTVLEAKNSKWKIFIIQSYGNVYSYFDDR
jgi:hypothetical protein